MGAALIRKCWDVQEEKWGGKDYYDYESNDYYYHYDYHYENQYKNYFKKQRQSI